MTDSTVTVVTTIESAGPSGGPGDRPSGAPGSGPALDYDDLVTAATVGIDRAPLPAEALAALAGPAGVLDAGDPAAALLDAAALLSLAARAGQLATEAGPVTPAPPDTAPELSRGASSVLYFALRGDPALLTDLLTEAAGAGFRAAAPMLPALLDAAVRDRSIRLAVRAVLGERGRWLAARRAEWQRVTDAGVTTRPGSAGAPAPGSAAASDPPPPVAAGASGPEIWLTGRRGERRDWLTALRRRAPDEARELLAAGWTRESGADRAEFLETLAIGLSGSDEPFLETALDDRAGSVRQVAARLLAQRPESGFTRRAVARAAAVLRSEQRGQHRTLMVTLPGSRDEAAARDGIGSDPPSRTVGRQAWLLTQLVAAMPLAEWSARLALTPAALAALPVANGFGVDVHAGWRLAAVAQRDAAWAAALLAAPPPRSLPPGSAPPPGRAEASPARDDVRARPPAAWPSDEELAAVLPAAAQLDRAAALLAEYGPSQQAVEALARCPGPWPPSVIDTVMRQLVRATPATRPSRWILLLFPLAARRLPTAGPRDYVADLRTLAASAAPGAIAHGLRQVADTVERRRYFRQELHP